MSDTDKRRDADITEGRKLFIGNITYNTRERELEDLFSKYGSIKEVRVAIDSSTGRSRGYAFITMSNADDAQAAVKGVSGNEVDGRNVRVEISHGERGSGGGGGGNRDRGGNYGRDNRRDNRFHKDYGRNDSRGGGRDYGRDRDDRRDYGRDRDRDDRRDYGRDRDDRRDSGRDRRDTRDRSPRKDRDYRSRSRDRGDRSRSDRDEAPVKERDTASSGRRDRSRDR